MGWSEEADSTTSAHLEPRILGSSQLFIAFKTRETEKAYHFNVINEQQFIRDLDNESISAAFAKISLYPRRRQQLCVTLLENEMISGKINHANFYY